jgi:disulfide bond formation protein DsbB
MKKQPHYLFIFLACIAMLGAALFFQLVIGLEPCPLCIFQRLALISIGLIALLAFLHNPRGFGDRVYSLLLIIAGLGSVGIATRHVWLLSLPKDEAASCGPGLEIWLDRFITLLPQGTVTETLFRSGAECTDVNWSLWGFSLPQLTFPLFIIFFLYFIWMFFKQNIRDRYSR